MISIGAVVGKYLFMGVPFSSHRNYRNDHHSCVYNHTLAPAISFFPPVIKNMAYPIVLTYGSFAGLFC